MQEPFKKPEIPSNIPAQKDKEEMSWLRTDIVSDSKPEDKYDKQKDTVLPKMDIKHKISQKKAKMTDEVSPRPIPEEDEISSNKQEVISLKKEQPEITIMPKTEVKQYILHEKKGLAIATEEITFSNKLEVASVPKLDERIGATSLVRELVLEELKEELVPKTDKKEVTELKKKEIILISEDKSMALQSVKATSVLKPEKIADIPPLKKEFVLTSEEEIVLQEPRIVPVPLIKKKEDIPFKKEIFLISEEEILLKEPSVVPVSIIEKKESIPLTKNGIFLISEEEKFLHKPKVEPVPKPEINIPLPLRQDPKTLPVPIIEKKEGIPLKKKDILLTSEEKISVQKLKEEHAPKTETNIPHIKKDIVLISEEEMVLQEPKVVPVPVIEKRDGMPLKKKEVFLTAEEEKVLHKPKVEPVSKPEKGISLIKKEFVLTSEEITEPQELVPKIEKSDITLKKGHISASEDKLTTQKESPAPKIKQKEDKSSKEQDFALHPLTPEPKIEQGLVKKHIDLTSKGAELTPQKHDITPDTGKKIKYLRTPKKEETVSQKAGIITTVSEKTDSMKMDVVTSEQEPQLKRTVIIPEDKTEVEEDVPLTQKSATSLEKKESVPHKKEDTLIPAKDDREVFLKGVAAKGTMAINALSFLSLHVFLNMNSLHMSFYCCLVTCCLTCTYS